MALFADVLVAIGVLAATWPWTSGGYTWLVQQRLSAATAPAPATRSTPATRATAPASAEETRDPVWDGWEREDARDWLRTAEGAPLGRIEIPRLDLEVTLVKGATEADLRRGPGWVRGTQPPGPEGNFAVSGHRTTFLAPFRDLDRLERGDEVVVETRYRRYTYRMTRRSFAEPNDIEILLPTPRPRLTLTTCHPPYSNRFRLVVHAELVRVARRR